MQHQFGDTEKINDPWGTQTFDVPVPPGVGKLNKGHPCEIQEYGEHDYRPDSSPIQKPGGGFANVDGPLPDLAQGIAMPAPVGTKRRLGPPKTDK